MGLNILIRKVMATTYYAPKEHTNLTKKTNMLKVCVSMFIKRKKVFPFIISFNQNEATWDTMI